ncbi:polysaccharide deacetylase family protein [Geodermatophilus sp. SYSU D00684]
MSVVLMYHRVAAPARDPYGLAVHPDRFAAHVEELSRRGGVVPLEDLTATRSARQIAVTFDDGYADNATVAAPLLAAAGLPATWFITAGRLGRRRFWWDRLADGLLGGPATSADVTVAGRDLWLDLRTREARRTALRFVHRLLRPLPPDLLEDGVDDVLRSLGALPHGDEDGVTMTPDQLRRLADLPLQEVGAHTRTHLQLRDQSEDLQREEVLGSVHDLTALLGRPVRTFAYPFGSAGAVGSLAPRLVAEAGCTLACGTDPGPVGRRSDRYRLPRLNVQDWDGATFAARLGELLEAR